MAKQKEELSGTTQNDTTEITTQECTECVRLWVDEIVSYQYDDDIDRYYFGVWGGGDEDTLVLSKNQIIDLYLFVKKEEALKRWADHGKYQIR